MAAATTQVQLDWALGASARLDSKMVVLVRMVPASHATARVITLTHEKMVPTVTKTVPVAVRSTKMSMTVVQAPTTQRTQAVTPVAAKMAAERKK